jgi:hypothetical protein
MKNAFSLLGLLIAVWSGSAAAADPASTAGLDQKRIHAEYNEGNFEKVISALETFMAHHPSYSHSDSIFIAKHLAVVYSANPDSREKGKYYMYRLLELLPSAKLVDMYVSDEIDRIFDKVREEFLARQQSFGVDTTALKVPAGAPANDPGKKVSIQEPPPSRAAKQSGGTNTFPWIAGGAAVVVASVATYFILNETDEPKDKTYVVP